MEPILNIITVLAFLGVVQGFFLGVFFLIRGGDAAVSNRYLGLFLFALACIILEMMLGYSGYLIRVIHLADFSEPLNFVLGPLLFLAVRSRIQHRRPFRRRHLLHLMPFAGYALYHIPYLLQSGAFKEAVWMQAWREPGSGAAVPAPTMDLDPLLIRARVTELTIVHLLLYMAAAFRTLFAAFRARGLPWWGAAGAELVWLRTFLLRFCLTGLSVVLVKLMFDNDLGDHIIALCMTAVVYATSASVIGGSQLLDSVPREKYRKSALAPERAEALLARLGELMARDKPHLRPSLTLPELAAMANASTHHVSQVLNESLDSSFHEYLAGFRVEEAKRLLSGPERDELRIEDLAERVGYYSKSSFNAAFRRITGLTPSQFRSSQGS